MGRILALDVGASKIGLAMSDAERIIAQPLDYVVSPSEAVEEISSLVREYDVEKLVIGLPKTGSGSEGVQAEETKRIAQALAQTLNLPIEYFDERFTTKEALNFKTKHSVPLDSLAAQKLLEQYLKKLKTQNAKSKTTF